ncbi:MAG: transposase [Candidatus Aureabacteria bacterium]|nr:transposase [Candidatus Auribacterota bacterium]
MVQYRRHSLENGYIYHVFTKTIAGFKVFNNDDEFLRILNTITYYQIEKPLVKFHRYEVLKKENLKIKRKDLHRSKRKIVEIIAYCIMPTHIHFVLKQIKKGGISKFMGQILNSYARYFNIKYKRKGPLWAGRFKSVLVETDEQLLHLTRYVHLNPVTSFLVNDPKDWKYSSLAEYITHGDNQENLCDFKNNLDIQHLFYEKFVNDRISYQRDLKKLEELVFE